jgi:hypothetical protein
MVRHPRSWECLLTFSGKSQLQKKIFVRPEIGVAPRIGAAQPRNGIARKFTLSPLRSGMNLASDEYPHFARVGKARRGEIVYSLFSSAGRLSFASSDSAIDFALSYSTKSRIIPAVLAANS